MAKQKIAAVGTFTPPPETIEADEPKEIVSQTRKVLPNVEPDAKGRLRISGFGFDFPAGKKVVGVQLKITREATFTDGVVLHDSHLCLMHDGRAASDNFHSATPWPQGASVAEYGGEGNKLGCRLKSEQVNEATFGVIFGTGFTAPTADVSVDGAILEVAITVWCE